MNPRLDALHAYPFERLNALKADLTTRSGDVHIALSIGEPRHAPPSFIIEAMRDERRLAEGLGSYPPTRGGESLRAAMGAWTERRFRLTPGSLTSEAHLLPVNGTREALFSLAQALVSGPGSAVLLPNPFYQIYEGAALLAGAEPYYVDCPQSTGFLPDYERVPERVWRRCELLYLCTPGNPTGAVIPLSQLEWLIEAAERYGFVIAADECYSEIYLDESRPPPGLLEACAGLGRDDYRNCIVLHSLSKRSNLPGLRSGFVAGDARLIERYYRYRTYHGCAMPAHVQAVSELAWNDEAHVRANRTLYREKFEKVTPLLAEALPVEPPAGGFYYWPEIPDRQGDDETYARRLFERCNVTVLPGSYLGRERNGRNPGSGRVRMAMVGSLEECIEAARRIREV